MEKLTRLELIRLRKALKKAKKGLSLLDKKRKTLMKEFLSIVYSIKKLREVFDKNKGKAFTSLAEAIKSYDPYEIGLYSFMPRHHIKYTMNERNIMGVSLKELNLKLVPNPDYEDDFFESLSLDELEMEFYRLLVSGTKLAFNMNRLRLLADELIKTNRRVNVLKYVVIPRTQQKIKRILERFDEIEREEKLRLKIIKERLESSKQNAY